MSSEPQVARVEPRAPAPGQLARALTFRDVILFNLVAVLGLRWLATSAAAGPSALTLWVLAALLFFVPLGLVVAEFSTRYPSAGGVYTWTKLAFGERHGFLCGWCYWVNNLLYYPSLLLAAAVIAPYGFGAQGSGIADNWVYVIGFTLGGLWLAVILNVVGVTTGRWLQNLGGLGSYLPGLVLIVFGVIAMLTRAPANDLSPRALVPDFSNLPALNLWASIAFAFAGIELAGTLGEETEAPRRTLPRAVLISAALIVFLYLAGTASVLWLVPTGEINVVSGLFQAIEAGSHGLEWLVSAMALLYVIGNLGGVGAWLSGPARVAFTIGLDRYFPPAFSRIHPRWKTPHVAIIVQASIATVFLVISVLGKGTTVERAYLIMLDTMILVYFIPFIYVFLAFFKLRHEPGAMLSRRPLGRVVAVSGLILTLLAMVLATIPPPGTDNKLLFWAKVIGGSVGFVLVGGVFYLRGKRA